MIESIIEWSVRNRYVVILAALALAVAGARAMLTMPVDAIPDLSENQVIVFTDWMGRSPQEIEDQITYPLSVNLQGLAGVKVVRSSSEFNFSMIIIIFDEATDFYFARTRVLERLSIASTFLPPGVTPYLAADATAVGQIFWYTVEGDGKDLSELRSIQDWYVRYQLNSVPGVAEVASVGGAPREYQVNLDPNKLRAYGISLGEVYSAVARSNSAVGGRVIHQGNAEYLIRSVGWIQNVDDIRNSVVAERNGTPICLKNLGAVQIGQTFRRSVLEKDGKEVVGGVVLMRYGENPLEVTRRIKEKITALQAGLPPGVRIVPFYDRTPLIHRAIETVSGAVREELDRLHPGDPGCDGPPGGCVCGLAHPAHGDPLQLPDDAAFRDVLEHHEPGRDRDQHRHLDRPGGCDGRERGAPLVAPVRPRTGHRRHHRHRDSGLPHGGAANLLLGADHHPLVPSGLRSDRPRGQALPSPGVHQNLRPDRGRPALDHARSGADPDLPQGPHPVRGRELAGADDDRDLQADAFLADGPAGTGDLAVYRDRRPGLCRLDEAGPGVHAASR